MRNHWKIIFNCLIVLTFLLGTFTIGQAKKTIEKNQRIESLDNLSFIELLNSVDVGSSSSLIQKFQNKEAKNNLINKKYNPAGECTVEVFRNKEVLLVTIPAHLLFGPNSTTLLTTAGDYLAPIKRYLKDPDMYRVILVMHTDNTGSEEYRDALTMDRVDSVFQWFYDNGTDTSYLFSFALGDDMPLVLNNSMENRDKNRRLEIYLVPGEKMIEQASKGRIAF